MSRTSQYEKGKEYLVHANDLKRLGFSGNEKKEIAKRMNVSWQQAYRYCNLNRLVPGLQEMVNDNRVPLNGMDQAVQLSDTRQQELYCILRDILEGSKNTKLTRDQCQEIIRDMKRGRSYEEVREINRKKICSADRTWTKKQSTISGNSSQPAVKDFQCLSKTEKGKAFQNMVYDRLEKCGFSCRITKEPDDGGDILAEKGGIRYVFQCKYKSIARVDKQALYEVYYAMDYYRCHVGVIVSNQSYTNATRIAADKCNILLWQMEDIKL